MSLNLGPEAFEAIQRLQNNSDWRAVVTALQDTMSVLMHRAIEGPRDERVDATGYARCMRDLTSHILLIEAPQPANRYAKVPVKPQREPARV